MMIESIRLLDAIADFWKSSNPPGVDPYLPHSRAVICAFIHSVTLLYISASENLKEWPFAKSAPTQRAFSTKDFVRRYAQSQ